MKKAVLVILALVLAAATMSLLVAPAAAQNETTIDLIAGQNTTVGTVSVWNDQDGLHVTYQTTGDWVINATHLSVAAELCGIPQTDSGNPVPGHFANSATYGPSVTTATYIISVDQHDVPIDNIGTLYIAAYAEVSQNGQTEGAWAGDEDFSGHNWATYFEYQMDDGQVDFSF